MNKNLGAGLIAGTIVMVLLILCFVGMSWCASYFLNIILSHFAIKPITTGCVMAGVVAIRIIKSMINLELE